MSEPSTLSLVDERERALALDPTQSFIVEAPAGSGKTTLLTQRFLRLLTTVPQPESVIAITFSRKAAEEMRSRIIGALNVGQQTDATLDEVTAHWAKQAVQHAEKHAWDVVANPRRLRILTIDALAQLIVRRHPILAGGTGGQQLLEDSASIYTLAARNTIEEIATGSEWSSAVRSIVSHVDNHWARLETLLADMLAIREQWLQPVASKPERAAVERAISVLITRQLELLVPRLADFDQTSLLKVCQFCGEQVAAIKPDAEIAKLRDLTQLPTASAEDLPTWRALAALFLTKEGEPRKRLTKNEGFPAKDDLAKTFKAQLSDIIADADRRFLAALAAVNTLPDLRFSDHAWEKLEALFMVLKLAAAHLGLVFQQTGKVDFTEVTLSALTALGSDDAPSDASLLLDYQITHLLVDEFQDTSQVQYQLIERLIAGWDAAQNRSLFLVGDPMQSIYRFRQADVSRFTATFADERLAQMPMTALRLRANFRSDPVVVEWINHALDDMSRAGSNFSAATRLAAVQATADDARVLVHPLESEASPGQRVLSLVREIFQKPPDKGLNPSVAVLVRNRSHLGDVTSALQAANINTLASDIDGLLEHPVIGDLSALSRALIHPADTIAWLAILRAPWLGLNLVELTQLRIAAPLALIPEILARQENFARLPKPSQARLAIFADIISTARNLVGRVPIAEVVADAWHALRGNEIADIDNASHYVNRYLNLLADFEAQESVLTVGGLQRFLSKRFISPATVSGNAVQVMTIHKAKGLEFDVVIIAGMNRGTRTDPNTLLRWQNDEHDSLLMSLLPAKGSPDRLYEYLRGQDKLASDAESYRLLYVALTRAKKQLHLLCDEIAEDKQPLKGSLQQLLWPAISAQASNLQTAESVAGSTAISDSTADVPVTNLNTLRRLTDPLLPARQTAPIFHPPDPEAELEFDWASSTAKYIGTVTHELMQQIALLGLPDFEDLWARAGETLVERRLLAIGIDKAQLASASVKVTQAVDTVLKSDRGRWLFSSTHEDARSEFPLTAVTDRETMNVILDRTFVADKVRWIVDFKMSEHLAADLENFLDIQVERYLPQLNRYAGVFAKISREPIMLALYFPLHDAWRAWEYQTTESY
ncbi:MAG: UvrD-helicase domain-containing protein [Pseudomonadota bacterium]